MPIHSQILTNIHALLDFNQVTKEAAARARYFSDAFQLSLEESLRILGGEQVPNKTLLRAIADKFEVDALWLLQN